MSVLVSHLAGMCSIVGSGTQGNGTEAWGDASLSAALSASPLALNIKGVLGGQSWGWLKASLF